MKERKVEIGVHKDVLFIQKRNLSEEKSHLIADIKACEFKISQLQKKYDIIISSLGQSEDGEQLSVTYFKIKVMYVIRRYVNMMLISCPK
jgi:UDP-glucose:O-linked fucose beta-1,3-glucosyltransferase